MVCSISYEILEPRGSAGAVSCVVACDIHDVTSTAAVDSPRVSHSRKDTWCFQTTAIVRF
jgi:hypothetical protein